MGRVVVQKSDLPIAMLDFPSQLALQADQCILMAGVSPHCQNTIALITIDCVEGGIRSETVSSMGCFSHWTQAQRQRTTKTEFSDFTGCMLTKDFSLQILPLKLASNTKYASKADLVNLYEALVSLAAYNNKNYYYQTLPIHSYLPMKCIHITSNCFAIAQSH